LSQGEVLYFQPEHGGALFLETRHKTGHMVNQGWDFVNENYQLSGFDFRMWNGGNCVKDALSCAPIAYYYYSCQIEAG
jgi:hypothetical protein